MIKSLTNFTLGVVFALTGNMLYQESNKYDVKHDIGTCLSNGLFYEKITDIKHHTILQEPIYVMEIWMKGKKSLPTTVEAWIADNSYVKVDTENCRERKL